MNGLRWLRIRCNLSTSELADQLGVTRQAVCSWESGKKAIPEKRKNQMAAFFGIDRTYFDEIDEEKRNELIQKAMYFYQKDGKEIYLYRPNKTPKSHDETVTYFQKDREKSLDEEYLLAKKRKQQTIQEIEEQIEDKKETDCLLTKISHLHRGCDVYEITSMEGMELMVKKIMHDPLFLAQKSVDATEADKQIVTDLLDTLKANLEHCVGMAANMIGVKKNIIVVAAGPFQFVMINPVITQKSGAYQTEEGCLSLEGVRPCTRYQEIEVDYLDQNFKKQHGKYSGWTAQIIQHEIDHCNGIVI